MPDPTAEELFRRVQEGRGIPSSEEEGTPAERLFETAKRGEEFPPSASRFQEGGEGGGDPKAQLFRGATRGLAQIFDLAEMLGQIGIVDPSRSPIELTPEGNPVTPRSLRSVRAPETTGRFQGLAESGFERLGIPTPEGGTGFLEKAGEELSAGVGVGSALRRGGRLVGRLASEVLPSAGAAAGREVFEESGAGAEIAGGVTGGVVGATAPGLARAGGRPLLAIARFGKDVIRERISDSRAQRLAGERLRAMTDDRVRALQELDRVEQIREQVPGFQPTLGAATGDPGLRSLEESAFRTRTGSGPTALDLELARSSGNRAVREELIALRPPGDESASRAAVRSFIDRRMASVDEQVRAQRGLSGEDASRAVREEFDRTSTDLFDDLGRQFDDLEAEAARVGAVVPSQPVVQALRRSIEDVGRFENLRLPRDLVDRLQTLREEPLVAFEDLRSLERRLNAELGTAKQSGDRQALRQLATLKEGVEEALDSLGSVGVENPTVAQRQALAALRRHGGPEFPELAENYRNLKSAFTEAASRFREGPARELNVRRAGRLKIPESETLGLFFIAGERGSARADDFTRVFRDAPAAKAAMNDFIVERALRGVLDESGSLEPSGKTFSRISSFIRSHREALERFPEARDRVRSIANLSREAEEMGILGGARTAESIRQGALRLYVDEPSEAVRELLKLPPEQQARAATQLASSLGGDRDALEGLRRVMWDELESRVVRIDPTVQTATSPFVDPRLLQMELERFKPVLDNLFPKDHLRRVDRLVDMASINSRIFVPGSERIAPEFSPRSAIASSGIFNQFLGGVARTFRGLRLVERLQNGMGEQQMNELLRKAALDPELSRVLLEDVTPRNERRIVDFVASNLTTLPARVLVDLEQEPEETPRPDAGVLGTGGRP